LALRQQLEQGIKSLPGAVIFAEPTARLPNTVQCAFPGVDGEMLLMQLDRQGFSVSSGSACASGARLPSASLTAMGIPDDLATSALRISLGQQNSAQAVDQLLNAIKLLVPH
jgi:cysteine desulfurase